MMNRKLLNFSKACFTFCIIYYMIIKICGKNDVASTTY